MLLLDSTTDLDALLPIAPLSDAAQEVVDGIRYRWERDLLAWLAGRTKVDCTRSGYYVHAPKLKDWQWRRAESWGIFGEMVVEYDPSWPAQDRFAAPVTERYYPVTELGQEIAAEFASDED